MQRDNIKEEHKHGDCYVIAYREQKPGDILVHGLITPTMGPLQNITYNHAWIERDDKVIDLSIKSKDYQEMPKLAYYALGQIKTTYKYTYQDRVNKSNEFQTYGPWEKELLESEF